MARGRISGGSGSPAASGSPGMVTGDGMGSGYKRRAGLGFGPGWDVSVNGFGLGSV